MGKKTTRSALSPPVSKMNQPPNMCAEARLSLQRDGPEHARQCYCQICGGNSYSTRSGTSKGWRNSDGSSFVGPGGAGCSQGPGPQAKHKMPDSCQCVPCPCPLLAFEAPRVTPIISQYVMRTTGLMQQTCGTCGKVVRGRQSPYRPAGAPPLEFRRVARTAGKYPRKGHVITGPTPPICWANVEAGLAVPPGCTCREMMRPPMGFFDVSAEAQAERRMSSLCQAGASDKVTCAFPPPEPSQPGTSSDPDAKVKCTNPQHQDEVPITFGEPPPTKPTKAPKKKKSAPAIEPATEPADDLLFGIGTDVAAVGLSGSAAVMAGIAEGDAAMLSSLEHGDGTGVGPAELAIGPGAELGDVDIAAGEAVAEGVPPDATDVLLDAPLEVTEAEEASPLPQEVPEDLPSPELILQEGAEPPPEAEGME